MPTLAAKFAPGVKLSKTFAHSRDIQKTVEDQVLGYVVVGGGRGGAAKVWPLYRADIFATTTRKRRGKLVREHVIFSSYEQGQPLNGHTFFDDYEGCTFALIAWQAINALENRAALLKAQKKKAPDHRRATKPKAEKKKARR